MRKSTYCIALLALSNLTGCGQASDPAEQSSAPPTVEDFTVTLRQSLETASPGDVIEVPPGRFEFKRSLVLNTDGVGLVKSANA